MNVTVMVYQQRLGAVMHLTTLGLGPLSRRVEGRNRTKLRQSLVDRLRDAVTKAEAAELLALNAPAGLRLERVHLELTFRGTGRRWRASGLFPLIVAPYRANADDRFVVAYHPARQDEWFPVDSELPLEVQATRFFQEAWEDLDESKVEALRSNGRDSVQLLAFTGRPRDALSRVPAASLWDDLETAEQRQRRESERVLHDLASNVTSKSIDGGLPLGRARSPVREQLMAVLGADKPKPVIVVGPPGCGKSTLIRQWVADLVEVDGYPVHRNADRVREVWQISGKRIIAGMSHVGEWQQRCLDLLDNVRALKTRRRFLWVDDLHAWGRLGRSRDSDSNFALFFQSAVARGELTLIAECTPGQLQRLEEEASPFAALFTLVRLPATERDETLRMAIAEGRELERRHRVAFDAATFAAVVDQGGSLLSGRSMPGTALDLLRDLSRRLTPPVEGDPRVIRSEDVTSLLADRTGLPEAVLRPTDPLRAEDVEAALSRQVAGQPQAVRAAVDVVLRIESGLTDPRRPYAVYLFSGPTGTGKTELSRALATYLYGSESRLLRIDAGEYSTADGAARLAGDMFRPEGTLTTAVRAQPFCIVLIDEVEKAHPRVLNLLLQVFEDGRLTDAAGHVADFTHAVIVMTSNLGSVNRPAMGLGEPDVSQSHLGVDRAIKDFFSPELFNRIDRVVHFAPLTKEASAGVVDKELAKLLSRRGLVGRNVFVTVDQAVREIVVRHAFDARYGARPLKRWLEDNVGAQLADHFASEPDAALQLIQLYGLDGRLLVDSHALKPAETLNATWTLAPLLDASPDELRAALPTAAKRLEALEASDLLQGLSHQIQRHLAEHNRGSAHAGDRVHDLERLRSDVSNLRERLAGFMRAPEEEAREWLEFDKFNSDEVAVDSWNGGMSKVKRSDRRARSRAVGPASRHEMLAALADVAFLERAAPFIDDPSQQSVYVDISRVGQPRQQGRFDDAGSLLVDWLANAYLNAFGSSDAMAVKRTKAGGLAETTDVRAVHASMRDCEQVVLRMVGLGVRDFFEGEAGSHLWQSLGRLPEIVQVRVIPATAASPKSVIEELTARKHAFQAARARGEMAAMADPFVPPPVVRTYRFEPPLRANEAAPLEIEDYVLGYIATVRVRTLAEALVNPWLLRRSRAATS